jgi:hypothetical protein
MVQSIREIFASRLHFLALHNVWLVFFDSAVLVSEVDSQLGMAA